MYVTQSLFSRCIPVVSSAFALWLAACASAQTGTSSGQGTADAYSASPPVSGEANSAGQGQPAGEDATADKIPPFQKLPLVTWGPIPPGEEHPLPPRTLDLTHQVTHVRFDWTRKAVVGSTTLQLVAMRPTTAITLDAVNMTIKQVTGFMGSSSQVSGTPLKHAYNNHAELVITPPRPLQPGGIVTITVDYETVSPRKGAYFIDRKKVVWTQGEMIDTRHWVPTIDRPDDKTTWEFYITVPKNEKALSNGALEGTREVGTDSVEYHWVQDKKASTYHYSVVTGEYEVIRDQWEDIPLAYWTYPDSVEAAKRGFQGTPDMMGVFSRITGVKYPWAKYDQSAVPDFIFGGMENVTATTQNDKTVLIPASEAERRDAQALVSHELAHQWFGNIVTLKDWSHAWLNEGFATFLETVYFEESGQDERAAFNRVNDQIQGMSADRRARRPLVYARWNRDPVELFFSGHIYPKGAAVLDMMRTIVGDDAFWKACNFYLTRHAYDNVVTEDLRAAFEKTTGNDFKEFFQQWVYGAGFPALQVSQHYDAESAMLTLTAKQVQPRDSLTGFFTMNVDVTVLTDNGPVQAVANVQGETSTVQIPVSAAPRAIVWDPDKRWMQLVDFPRSTNMLVYQLQHGGLLARAEAIALLQPRASKESIAKAALQQAATSDASQMIRERAQAATNARR